MGFILFMGRYAFLIILLGAIGVFGSCATPGHIQSDSPRHKNSALSEQSSQTKPYGAYLAGRVAHLRRDFNKASDYYIRSLKIDPDNKELVAKLYLILVSQGRIDEAALYARQITQSGKSDNFANTVIAIQQMHNGAYAESISTLGNFDNIAYKDFIAPLLRAWSYAGLNKPDAALKELATLRKEPGFKSIYHFHAGMINDYFNRNREAQKHYETIIKEEDLEMSLRTLQVISNFYLRTQQKDKALQIVNSVSNEKTTAEILKSFINDVREADPKDTSAIITNPNIGAAEALFSIAATFRYDEVLDVAHMFISLAVYENPHYDLAKLLLANILEDRAMYAEANKVYDTIEEDSHSYYAAQLKMANNLIKQNDFDGAELLLKALAIDYDNAQIYLDLGDILRMKNRPQEAIKYYERAIEKTHDHGSLWVLYYALGVSYDQNEQWKKAEKALEKSLSLSNEHYLVLNYLGYSWIKQGKNVDKAFEMIVKAFNQAPDDPNINDSLGWALYNMGYYTMAVPYMEKAAETSPSNAVISDHLGDVYWFARRKNEARFQWRHALSLKDDTGELDVDAVHKKLEEGLKKEPELSYDKELVEKHIRSLISEQRKTASNR